MRNHKSIEKNNIINFTRARKIAKIDYYIRHV
jgi:hypothetical protein